MSGQEDKHSRRDGFSASGRIPAATRWFALLFAMSFPSLMTWIYFVVLARPAEPAGGTSYIAALTYAASKVGQFGFPLGWLFFIEHRRPAMSWPTARDLGLGLGFGALVALIIFILHFGFLRAGPFLASTPEMVFARIKLFHAETPIRYALLSIFIAGAHSLMEEYYWRWFVFGQLKCVVTIMAAAALSSLAFMAHHVIILWVYFSGDFFAAALPFAVCVATGGCVWAWLYERTGRLYASWLGHLLAGVGMLVVGYDMVFLGRAQT